MSIKYCSRCHFAALARKHICQTCGGKNFIYEEATVRGSGSDRTNPFHAIAGSFGEFVKEFSHDLAQTADKSVRASKNMAKLIKSKGPSQRFEK